jgi:pSer/pThr/pTyr-binding forkhead associated (FHA) protein
MKLKLFLEQTGQSWTLKANREYVVGSGNDCDIFISNAGIVAEHHLKFSFNPGNNTWHVSDLGSGSGTFINNQLVTSYPITAQIRIAIAGSVILVAIPEVVTPPTQPQVYNPQPAPLSEIVSQEAMKIEKLNWNRYIAKQVGKQKNWLARVATNFQLATGLRNTPWTNFDGYVIPNFMEKGTCF